MLEYAVARYIVFATVATLEEAEIPALGLKATA